MKGAKSEVGEEKDVDRFLKWAGILAMIALPVYLIFKKNKQESRGTSGDDDSNIFAAELEE